MPCNQSEYQSALNDSPNGGAGTRRAEEGPIRACCEETMHCWHDSRRGAQTNKKIKLREHHCEERSLTYFGYRHQSIMMRLECGRLRPFKMQEVRASLRDVY